MSVTHRVSTPKARPHVTEGPSFSHGQQTPAGLTGAERDVAKRVAARIVAAARGERVLQLGCGNSLLTAELAAHFPKLEVVEDSAGLAQQARSIIRQAERVYYGSYLTYQPKASYDVIVIAWMLERIGDPNGLLARAREWLAPGGQIYLVVPNSESLHRRIGARMGLLERPDLLGRSDLAAGHVRVYTWDTLSEVIFAAGLRVINMEGLLLRPLPNALMEGWPTDLRSAFFDLSYCAPRLCSEILAVCGHPESA
jgi:SAM-dependent methyltransferase